MYIYNIYIYNIYIYIYIQWIYNTLSELATIMGIMGESDVCYTYITLYNQLQFTNRTWISS